MPKRAGVSLIEVLIAATVVGIVMMALGGYITSTFGKTSYARDRAFAMQKALQMMEEMAAYKPPTSTSPGVEQFAGNSYLLTTVSNVDPTAPVSGNSYLNGRFKFVRSITVQPVSGEPKANLVTVSIWYVPKSMSALQSQTTVTGTMPGGPPLAVVSNILRGNLVSSIAQDNIDLYVISIENLPNVWRHGNDIVCPSTSEARAYFNNALLDLESKYPALNFRVHWISRLSIGRNQLYRPYVNSAQGLDNQGANGGATATVDPLGDVYFYPGLIEGNTTSPYYYDPNNIKGDIWLGSASVASQGAYPLCDEFNHAVRYRGEFDASGTPVTANSYQTSYANVVPITDQDMIAPPASDTAGVHSLSLRQFLEELLNDSTGKFKNAVVVNLHGELFPCIPLRNYSDAAFDPTDTNTATEGRRAVTHPRLLSYNISATSQTVTLLTHTYMADGGNTPSGLASSGYGPHVRVIIKNLLPHLASWSNPAVAGAIGDVKPDALTLANATGPYSGNCYQWSNNASDVTVSAGGPGLSGTTSNDVVVDYHTAFYDAQEQVEVHSGNNHTKGFFGIPQNNGGPDPNYLLDGLQYFPDPALPYLTQGNLPPNGNSGPDGLEGEPRNTAHGRVQFNLQLTGLPKSFTVVTQLERSNSTFPNVDDNTPDDSRTYFYTAGALSSLTGGGGVPYTDQLQLVGDPRDNPYEDVRAAHLYNPYFHNFTQNQNVYRNTQNSGSNASDYLDYANGDLFSADALPSAGTTPQAYDCSYPNTTQGWYGTNFNAPAYFKLWQQALLNEDMMFVNVEGEPIHMLGMGGEFAFNGGHLDAFNNIQLSQQPFNCQSGATNVDEMFGGKVVPLIQRSSGSNWTGIPWLGELFPPDQNAYFASHGNLLTSSSSGSNYFQRSQDFTFDQGSGAKNDWSKQVNSSAGFAWFLNALGTDGQPIAMNNHNDNDSSLTGTTGKDMAAALAMKLNSPKKADYFYDNGGSTPPGWNNGATLNFNWLDAAFADRGYYQRNGHSDFSDAPILLTDNSTPVKQAVVLATTFRPVDLSDVPPMLDITATSLAAAYYDWTQQSLGQNNNAPVSRIKITAPTNDQTVSGNSVPITWYSRWMRPDVTEFVPNTYHPAPAPAYDPTVSQSNGGPLPLVYYLKLEDSAGHWQTINTDLCSTMESTDVGLVPWPTITPILDGTPCVPTAHPGSNAITAHWDSTTVPNGTYNLRVEAFRQNASSSNTSTLPIPVNYGSYEITVYVAN